MSDDNGKQADTQQAGAAAAPEGPQFRIENILIKNLSLEMPDKVVAPAFSQDPTIKMEMRNSSRKLSRDDYYEVTLDVTFRLQNGEEVQLLIEAAQSGIVFLQNADARQRDEILNIHAPEMLYPYACQLTSELMARAGAPRLFLPPFNFRDLHQKKVEAINKKIAAEKSGERAS